MEIGDVDSAARTLRAAERDRRAIERITGAWPGMDEAAAYQVQDRLIAHRLTDGEALTGFKLGLTTRAKQRQMGVDAPITGWLTNAHRFDGEVDAAKLIHPRVEPEIVLIIGRELTGPDLSTADVREAVTEVRAGMEIIDSRYRDFSFALPDVVADNTSAAGYVVGETVGSAEMDLVRERVELLIDGQRAHTATGAEIYPDPLTAVARAVNQIFQRGKTLPKGFAVFAGALTAAVPLESGVTYTARFSTLGDVAVTAR